MTRVLLGNTNWTSPYVLSCFVALREKGLPFELREIALDAAEHHSAAFAKETLTSRVPVLIEDGLALSESSAIVEYLEDAYPAPAYFRVLPADVRARARARQVMAWLRSDLMPIREERSAEYVFYPHAGLAPLSPLTPLALKAAAKLIDAAQQLVPADGSSMFGAWCIADTDLAMMMQRLLKSGFELPSNLSRFATGQWQRPAVLEFCEHARPPYRRAQMML
jgi:glutathione S-transferase